MTNHSPWSSAAKAADLPLEVIQCGFINFVSMNCFIVFYTMHSLSKPQIRIKNALKVAAIVLTLLFGVIAFLEILAMSDTTIEWLRPLNKDSVVLTIDIPCLSLFGLILGLCLSLLAGRIENRVIAPNIRLISLLYLFALLMVLSSFVKPIGEFLLKRLETATLVLPTTSTISAGRRTDGLQQYTISVGESRKTRWSDGLRRGVPSEIIARLGTNEYHAFTNSHFLANSNIVSVTYNNEQSSSDDGRRMMFNIYKFIGAGIDFLLASLKVMLYLIFSWLIATGRLLFYFIKSRDTAGVFNKIEAVDFARAYREEKPLGL